MTHRIRTFLQAVKAEVKKVTWPSRQEVVRSTIIVLLTVAIFAAIIGIMDTALYNLVMAVFVAA